MFTRDVALCGYIVHFICLWFIFWIMGITTRLSTKRNRTHYVYSCPSSVAWYGHIFKHGDLQFFCVLAAASYGIFDCQGVGTHWNGINADLFGHGGIMGQTHMGNILDMGRTPDINVDIIIFIYRIFIYYQYF